MCANRVHAPVRRGTAGHPWLPVGTSGATVSGADPPSGSEISLKMPLMSAFDDIFE